MSQTFAFEKASQGSVLLEWAGEGLWEDWSLTVTLQLPSRQGWNERAFDSQFPEQETGSLLSPLTLEESLGIIKREQI